MVSIGIHIKKDSLSLAVLGLEGTRPQFHFFEEAFFEKPDSEEDKNLFILRSLEKIEEKYKGKAIRWCYGLSQSFVSDFFVEFPFKEKFKILKTLPFEIEDRSPFRSDKVYFDARICKITDKNKSSTLCFVTPEENVKDFLEFSKKVKRPAWLLSCEGAASANLLESWNKPLSQVQNPMPQPLCIYLGEQNSQTLLYKEGHLTNVSVLDWSVAPIIEEMKKFYNLSTQKAWEEFFAKSFILTESRGWTKEQLFFSNVIKKHVGLLIPKLKLLKMSLETEQGFPISSAVLFGPGAVVKNLTAFLTAELSIKCSRLKNLEDYSSFGLEDKPSSYIALGLALEGLKGPPYQGLNFLQAMKKEAFSLFPKKWQKAGLVALLCFLVFTAYAFVRKRESSLILEKVQGLFVDYGKRLAFLPESRVTVDSLNSFLEKEKEKMKDEQIIQKELRQPNPMDHLQRIVQKVGPASKWNLSIRYLKVEGNEVEIKGLVERTSLRAFKAQLQSLAKGTIKEHPSRNLKEAVLAPSKPNEDTSSLAGKRVSGVAPSSDDKEEPGALPLVDKKPETFKSWKNSGDPAQEKEKTETQEEDRLSFSHSFRLKKEL